MSNSATKQRVFRLLAIAFAVATLIVSSLNLLFDIDTGSTAILLLLCAVLALLMRDQR